VVTHAQLLDLGFSRNAIEHRIAKGRLLSVMRGVYAVGRPQLTREGRWMAAVLSCGPEATLSHDSAAAHLRIRPFRAGEIEISVPARLARVRPGIVAHRRRTFAASDVMRHDGIPVTTPICTLIDLAARLERGPLERAINEADGLHLIDLEQLREVSLAGPAFPCPKRSGTSTPSESTFSGGTSAWSSSRQPALPPHARSAGEGPRSRSGARSRRPHGTAVHPRPSQVRAALRSGDARDRCSPPQVGATLGASLRLENGVSGRSCSSPSISMSTRSL
jgi:hypothetical protein